MYYVESNCQKQKFNNLTVYKQMTVAQSAGAVEYTDCASAEG